MTTTPTQDASGERRSDRSTLLEDLSTHSAMGVLVLMAMRGIGPQTAEKLAQRFGCIKDIWDRVTEAETVVPSSARRELRNEDAWRAAWERAQATLESADARNVRVVSIFDPNYPELLKAISDRPLVLYVRGHLRNSTRSVACVGTREPSRFGEEVTKRIAALLASNGWSIVSGLALGVDSLAHEAALEAKGHTVAILANGLDSVYPRGNQALAERILEAGGALVSEQPVGTPLIPRNLVLRDRLQSGMSVGTIVMQTDVVGGTMHTVRFTLTQGRLLFAPVPRGDHAAEAKSRGILALTQVTGASLASLVDAADDYAKLLKHEFATAPVAKPLEGRADYEQLLSILDEAAVPKRSERQQSLGF